MAFFPARPGSNLPILKDANLSYGKEVLCGSAPKSTPNRPLNHSPMQERGLFTFEGLALGLLTVTAWIH